MRPIVRMSPFNVVTRLTTLRGRARYCKRNNRRRVFRQRRTSLSKSANRIRPYRILMAQCVMFRPIRIRCLPSPFIHLLRFNVLPIRGASQGRKSRRCLILLRSLFLRLIRLFRCPFSTLIRKEITPMGICITYSPKTRPLISLRVSSLISSIIMKGVRTWLFRRKVMRL